MSVELRRDPDRTPFRFQNGYPLQLDGRMSATVFLTRMRAINHALISPKPKISRRTRNRLLLFVFLGFLLVIGSNPAQLFGQGNVLQLMAMICVALFLAVLLVLIFDYQYRVYQNKLLKIVEQKLDEFNETDNAVGVRWRLNHVRSLSDSWMNPGIAWTICIDFIEPVALVQTVSGSLVTMPSLTAAEEDEEQLREVGLPPPAYHK